MKRTLFLLTAFAAIFLCHLPALRNGFVWDDQALVLRDPLIRSWRLVPEAFNHFLFVDATASNFYRPIQRLSYTLDYALFAFRPAGYHLSSILYHLLAAGSVFLALRELCRLFGLARTRSWQIGLAVMLLWGIHPVHSAAVQYVAGRADPLAALFGFTGFYLGLRSLRQPRGRTPFLAGAAVCFTLSSLSKENGFIFLALWPAAALLARKWRALPAFALVALVVVSAHFSLRLAAQQVPPPPVKDPMPALVRPVVMARAVAEYAGLLIFPLRLHMERDVETRPWGFSNDSVTMASWRELQTLAGFIIVGLLAWWLWRTRRRHPEVFACLVLGLVAYLPVSGLYSLNATVAEHWLYVPAVFFLAAAILQLSPLLDRARPVRATIFSLLLLAWGLFLGGRTFLRAEDWRDQEQFLERTIAHGGGTPRMLINLGGFQLKQGKLAEAEKSLNEALRRQPDQPLAVINLAALALKKKEFARARELAEKALTLPLVEAQGHELLAVIEHQENGEVDLRRLHLATRTGAPSWAIEKRYVEVLAEGGALEAAIRELRKVLQTEWYRAETWVLLGKYLQAAGKTAEADEALAQARRYDVHLARP